VPLDRLWAGWRSDYVSGLTDDDIEDAEYAESCVLCRLAAATDDEEALVLERTDLTFTVMNLYPYGSGHLMVAPLRHVATVELLEDDETVALARAQTRAVRAIRDAYGPDGLNLGANLGRAAGAGVPGHLHVHVLPRWSGDTNFMTAVAETRVLPERLDVGYQKLRKHWPDR
jgi:ATP adenylyltransferase